MLALDSPRWSELAHAYGAAADIPGLLSRLASGDDAAEGELFGAICHQGGVYSASFAAFPHLIQIAKRTAEAPVCARVLILAGAIATSRDVRCDLPLPTDLRSAYDSAVAETIPILLAALREAIDSDDAVDLLEAAATLSGFTTLHGVLTGFLNDEFCCDCPGCESELYVWPCESGLSIAAQDPVSTPATPRTPVRPGPDAGSRHEAAFEWLREMGGNAALSRIGGGLPYLFGSGLCPACGAEFCLLDELGTAT